MGAFESRQGDGYGRTHARPSALSSRLSAFFEAYASGDEATLNRFLAPGVSLSGFGGAVTYSPIAGITVPWDGATRDITVTVTLMLPGQVRLRIAELTQTYDMSAIDQLSGRWYVKEPGESSQPWGAR